MNTQLSIELVTEPDILKAGALMEEMWREHGQQSVLIDTKKILAPTGPGYIRDFLNKPQSTVFVAKTGGEVIGVVSCLIQPLPAHYIETTEAYIDDLCVSAEYRRHGVGTQLVKKCEEFAAAKGVKVLSAKVWHFNSASANMLEQSGYANQYSYFFKNME